MQQEQNNDTNAITHRGHDLMGAIIAKTYSRHAKMSSEEFIEAIGFKDSGKTENEAVLNGIANVLIESTKQLLVCKDSLIRATAILQLLLKDDENKEEKSKEEEK